MLRALPALTEFVIHMADFTPETLPMILTEGLLPNLQKFEGCKFSFIQSAIEFLNSRWSQTASGNYPGLREFVFWLARDNYSAGDQQILESLLPEWEMNERSVRLMIQHDQ